MDREIFEIKNITNDSNGHKFSKNLKSEILKLKIISLIMMINLKKLDISQMFTPC